MIERLTPTSTKLWRSLVRVDSFDTYSGIVFVIVPAWSSSKKIGIKISSIPEEIFPKLLEGSRLHAMVNIGTEQIEDLHFKNWEKD